MSVKEFIEHYEKRFGEKPNYRAAFGYTEIQIYEAAVRQAGSRQQPLRVGEGGGFSSLIRAHSFAYGTSHLSAALSEVNNLVGNGRVRQAKYILPICSSKNDLAKIAAAFVTLQTSSPEANVAAS